MVEVQQPVLGKEAFSRQTRDLIDEMESLPVASVLNIDNLDLMQRWQSSDMLSQKMAMTAAEFAYVTDLVAKVRAWHEELKQAVTPGQPVDSEEPKTVREYLARQEAVPA